MDNSKLCVGVNKVALLRASRQRNVPDLIKVAEVLFKSGLTALRVHCWPDQRHVVWQDIIDLSRLPAVTSGQMRLEVGGTIDSNVPHILKKAKAVSCFVATPFNRQHVTTEHGWQPQLQRTELIALMQSIQPVETQLFVDPEIASIEFAAEIGACGVEISCRDFVVAFNSDSRMNEIDRIARAIEKARALKLRVGIAHDLGQKHIQCLNSHIEVDQICVGHTFVADALMAGMQAAFNDYVELL